MCKLFYLLDWLQIKKIDLASLSVPHSDLVSPFHRKCLKVLNMFKEECSDCVLAQNSSKSLYNLLLDSDDHAVKIVERNVDIDYSVIFKNISDKFIDKFSIDVMHRIIHEILPVIFECLNIIFLKRINVFSAMKWKF